ncbi:5-formyltetrahydrofolate cyclo-ligase [Sphingorhabdus lutea]|uniref:5-formyltetrahydrofolate cyclo-ligase n=1 Tax=Sphingorhabdus lutea TaxID=1913578 RepID=UPI0018DD6121|nr:5-formyltetrahydrofolate cyclo-ligase [Sphingorhabdus lutea]
MYKDIIEQKKLLRHKLREKRNKFVSALPPSILNIAFTNVPRPLLQICQDKMDRKSPIAAFYAPMGSEADPLKLAQFLSQQDIQIALPRIFNKEAGLMNFHLLNPNDLFSNLEIGPFGAAEPHKDAPICSPDIIFTPLIGFNRLGARLGQGGGFYDRAFAALPQCVKIGIGWSIQEESKIPIDIHDISLDYILTEREYIEI